METDSVLLIDWLWACRAAGVCAEFPVVARQGSLRKRPWPVLFAFPKGMVLFGPLSG